MSGWCTYSPKDPSAEGAKSSAAADLCASETGRTAVEMGAKAAATRRMRRAAGAGRLPAMAMAVAVAEIGTSRV